jgi:hypothetical protein
VTITGKQVVSAAMASGWIDPRYPPPTKKALEKYLNTHLMQALKPLLNQSASAKRIVEAQLKHVECYLDSGALYDTFTAASPNDPHAKKLAAMAQMSTKKIADMLKKTWNQFDELLRQSGMSERDYLLSLELEPGTAQKILSGKMTIGELLIDQPLVILDYSL